MTGDIIRNFIDEDIIISNKKISDNQIQPASLDLRLGLKAWRVRASFLPGPDKKVKEKIKKLAMHEIDLSKGCVFEKGCV